MTKKPIMIDENVHLKLSIYKAGKFKTFSAAIDKLLDEELKNKGIADEMRRF